MNTHIHQQLPTDNEPHRMQNLLWLWVDWSEWWKKMSWRGQGECFFFLYFHSLSSQPGFNQVLYISATLFIMIHTMADEYSGDAQEVQNIHFVRIFSLLFVYLTSKNNPINNLFHKLPTAINELNPLHPWKLITCPVYS